MGGRRVDAAAASARTLRIVVVGYDDFSCGEGPRMSDEKNVFYSNSSAIGTSPFDVTVVFQRRGLRSYADKHEGKLQNEVLDELEVIMSYQHAQLVAVALMNAVLEIKASGTSIPVPADDQKRFGELIERIKNGAL